MSALDDSSLTDASLTDSALTPRDRQGEWTPSELRRVVVRLVDGDAVQVGTASNRAGALTLARSLISEIEGDPGQWPLVGNRLLRPDSVLSVDLVTAG